MNSVWIVDDDESIRFVLERALGREGFDVRAFATARECLDALDGASPKVLLSDIRMPGASGIELLEEFRRRRPTTPVIIMTAYSDLESAVSALQGGAFEYLPKPFDLPAAVELVRRAIDESARESDAEETVDAQLDMLGQAPAMQDVFRAIGRLSQSSATVLITGESGTGKELVARALHRHSPRAGQGFVALNTAAIPRDLLESELFGHERGAFTGAQQLRRGRFEQASGGTLFLDEIGDMAPEMQTRLLRVLSDGQYYRVGGHQPQKADARVIAATHQDLEERVRQGLFREDLFHRLNVIRLRLPALRERREDIPVLVRHFLQRSARELGGEAKRLSPAALQAMTAYRWPGNVRQLENMCHWLTVMAPALVVDVRDLPPEILQGGADEYGARGIGEPGAASASGSAHGARANGGSGHRESANGGPGNGGPGNGGHATAGSAHGGSAYQEPSQERAQAGSVDEAASGRSRPTKHDDVLPGVGYGDVHAVAGIADAAAKSAGVPTSSAAVPGESSRESQKNFAASSVRTTALAGELRWERLLEQEVAAMLRAQPLPQSASDASLLMDRLTREFEATVIATALRHTGGRRIEAAHRLGIGRNTITRKIQELRIGEDPHEPSGGDERERS